MRNQRFRFPAQHATRHHARRARRCGGAAIAACALSLSLSCADTPEPPDPGGGVASTGAGLITAGGDQSAGATLPIGAARPTGSASGLLWLEPDGTIRLWDMASRTDYKAFALASITPSVWQPVGVGDLDGDGDSDILYRDAADRLLSIWRLIDTRVDQMTIPTSNAPWSGGVAGAPTGAQFGDFDGDGVSDVAWTGRLLKSVVQPGTSNPLSPPSGPSTGLQWVNRTETWLMNAGATTPRSTTVAESTGTTLLGVGNFDGDAWNTAETLQRDSVGNVSVVRTNGTSILDGYVSSDWTFQAVGDFNSDGTDDIVWYNSGSGAVSIWTMRNGAPVSGPLYGTVPPAQGWSIRGVSDVDHDGQPEILWRHTSGAVAFGYTPGPSLPVNPNVSFLGVVKLGAPPAPLTPLLDDVHLLGGVPYANVSFRIPTRARHDDQVLVQESSVPVPDAQRAQLMVPATALPGPVDDPFPRYRIQVRLDSFLGRDHACFTLRSVEQGRLSAATPQVCATGTPPPQIVTDWTMPDSFGLDENNDGAIDLTPSERILQAVRSNLWTINLTATIGNPESGDSLSTCWWEVHTADYTGYDHSFFGCQPTVTNIPQGSYVIDMKGVTPDGRSTFVSMPAEVKNHVIVSVGDSYAAGEGNPLKWGKAIELPGMSVNGHPAPPTYQYVEAFWGSEREQKCHRSANSAAARAAMAIERSNPKSSVTFISTACSGARLGHIIDEDYDGQERFDLAKNRPQLEQIKTLLCRKRDRTIGQFPEYCQQVDMPPIEALLVTGGGNDIGFGDIIKTCVTSRSCSGDADFVKRVHDAIAHLGVTPSSPDAEPASDVPQKPGFDSLSPNPDYKTYAELAGAIDSELQVKDVYINEYPDPTTVGLDLDHDGTFDAIAICDQIVLKNAVKDGISVATNGIYGSPLDGPLLSILGSLAGSLIGGPALGTVLGAAGLAVELWGPDDGVIGNADLVWTGFVVQHLNEQIGLAAQRWGWQRVTGISDGFVGHGYCADSHYIIRYEESQTQIRIREFGSMHPNQDGQVVIGRQVLSKLIENGIGDASSLAAMPTGSLDLFGVHPL